MTTMAGSATPDSVIAELDSLVNELKMDLANVNEQLRRQVASSLREAAAIQQQLQSRKRQVLEEWLEIATEVKQQVDQVATRGELNDYREIVSLAHLLTDWSNDDALAAETDTVRTLKEVARSATATKDQVRTRLVGDREAQAHEWTALVEQTPDLPFVRVIPLLHAHKLWGEVAQIVEEIKKPLEQLESVRKSLDLCDKAILHAILRAQSKHLQDQLTQLAADWRDAKSPEDTEEALTSLRQMLPLSPTQIVIPDDFFDAFWDQQEARIAARIVATRVLGLVQRGQDSELSFADRSSALVEAGQLALTLSAELETIVTDAKKGLQREASQRFDALNEKFRDRLRDRSHEEASQILQEMGQIAPYCENVTEVQEQITTLQKDLKNAAQPPAEERTVREFLAFLQDVEMAEDKPKELERIESLRKSMPKAKDLDLVPPSLRIEVTQTASQVLELLADTPPPSENSVWAFDNRCRYLKEIKKHFEDSISQQLPDDPTV